MDAAEIKDYSALASAAGISQAAIQFLCSGKRKGSVETLKKLATALNCAIDDLIVEESN